MKKIYNTPQIHIVTVSQQATILSGSVTGSISDETTGRAYSRGDDWDEED